MRIPTVAIPAAAVVLLAIPTTATASFPHVVAPGESLSSIAAIDGLTVTELAAANGLPPTAELLAGAQLAIPPQGGELASAEAATTEAPPTPLVGDGDEDSDDVSGAGTSAGSSSSASAATSQPVGAAAEGPPGGPPYPTTETVSPAEVSAIAAANGVPPSLANAIADEESGFNNQLVSSANARGVMQITPGTWSWIDQSLTGATPLAPASALENVRGGVLLLHSLLETTGDNETLAAAGYYQGLPSVLENGIYPSTQEYVATVQALQQRFGGG